MKILKLRFANLNSLQGEWSIDFTRPEYTSDGIFAITGPTGSGKSTILDAICLALYGQTPRLGKITRSSNELMSRHAGDCFAEVTFATQAGVFVCHWSQHRSRRKAGGELQMQKHEIADAEGNIIQSKVQETLAAIEERTGMDFDRFTRSMLLAQGGFSAFLQADPDRRAPVLEQITGTEIYSRISTKVHERLREERDRLALLRAETEALRLLGPEEVQRLEAGRRALFEKEAALSAGADEAASALAWLQEVEKLRASLLAIDGEAQTLDNDKAHFASDADRLSLARKAETLEPLYAPFALVRSQLLMDVAERGESQSLRPSLQTALQEAEKRHGAAVAVLGAATQAAAESKPLIAGARRLDAQIAAQRHALELLQLELENVRQRHAGVDSERRGLVALQHASRQELMQLRSWQEAHRPDALLALELSGIRHSLQEVDKAVGREREASRAAEESLASLRQAEGEVELLEPAGSEAKLKLEGAVTSLETLRESLSAGLGGATLKALRLEHEELRERQRTLAQILDLYVSGKELSDRIDEIEESKKILEGKIAGAAAGLDHARELFVAAEALVTSEEKRALLCAAVRSLEEERKHLVDGKPCPLCGSTHHPYAEAGAVPEPDDSVMQEARQKLRERAAALRELELLLAAERAEFIQTESRRSEMAGLRDEQRRRFRELFGKAGVEASPGESRPLVEQMLADSEERQAALALLIEKLETLESRIRAEEAALLALQEAAHEAHAGIEKSREALRSRREGLSRAEKELGEAIGELNSRMNAFRERVHGYCDAEEQKRSPEELMHLLEERGTFWQEQAGLAAKLDHELVARESSLRGLDSQLESLAEELERREAEAAKASEGLEAELGKRRELFGEKETAAEEERIDLLLRQSRSEAEETLAEANHVRQELGSLETSLAGLDRRIAKGGQELETLEASFDKALKAQGFSGEEAFVRSRLPEGERRRLEFLATELDSRANDIESRRKERAWRLDKELEQARTAQSADELQEHIEALREELREATAGVGAITSRLEENERASGELRRKAEALEALRTECGRWEALHDLIGSADGKKFRNFAQGLTFDIMISHANRQLVRMTERYVLVRDLTEPLELNVVDQWQAGQVRSTRNLSGGESFIVSLALALGLSQMSSRNVRVDSLFLDEGFGTLDEEALETALETLSGLQQTGKLIGIISHVPALKERIATQIRVDPLTGGRSALSGPGVAGPSCTG
ncbi:MAG TPA: AAA family ATPase [Chlorobaculum sp.]|nr:AAA family ATPase [Chlorobaculum sp.]